MPKALSLKQKEKRKIDREIIKDSKKEINKQKDAQGQRDSNMDLFQWQIARTYPPKVIIIIPIRDRESAKTVFKNNYRDCCTIKSLFINQDWGMPFNRGAMLNIGFLEVKKLFPNDYKIVTLVLHDVDVIPYPNINKKDLIQKFVTSSGSIKHIYGFNHTLGGVVAITGEDFERVGGFPNIYGWGEEDFVFIDRVKKYSLTIDRSDHHFINADKPSKQTLQISSQVPTKKDTFRVYCVSETERAHKIEIENDTFNSILSYNIDRNKNNLMVTTFDTGNTISLQSNNFKVYSLVALPMNLIKTNSKQKNIKVEDYFINEWSLKIHGYGFLKTN